MEQWSQEQRTVARRLRALGRTRSAVARALRVAGVRGVPDSTHECPVRAYLAAGGPEVVHVTYSHAWLRDGRKVTITDPVRDFLQAFDRGLYHEFRADA